MFTSIQLKHIILLASAMDYNNPSIATALRQLNEEMLMPAPPMFISI